MKRLEVLRFALEQYSDVLTLRRLEDRLIEVKVGQALTLVLSEKFLADDYSDGVYRCSIENNLLVLEPIKQSNWRNKA